jgi:prepilin-type N-terminal cleavage/methylation domain-containing protein
MKTPSQTSRRGFTLIELLVAMAITTIIITVLVSVTAMALETWNRSRAEIRAARQAKSMIDTMARDFESFVSRSGNTFEWLYAKSTPPSEGPNGSLSPNAIDLIFFSAATDRYEGFAGTDENDPDTGKPYDKHGDVSTVGYRLTYKDPIANEDVDNYKTFVLYRKLVNPNTTFGLNNDDPPIYDPARAILGKVSIKAPFEAADGEPIDKEVNFICENVYQFTVTFHVNSTVGTTIKPVAVPIGKGTKLVEEFRITGSGIQTTFSPSGTGAPTNAQLKAGRLAAAEISITVLSDFGMQQMRRRGDLTGAKLAEFIAEHSYQYSKVVQLPGS